MVVRFRLTSHNHFARTRVENDVFRAGSKKTKKPHTLVSNLLFSPGFLHFCAGAIGGTLLPPDKMQKTLGIPFLFVTHDQEEAMSMATHMGIMEKGVIKQTGTPVDLYDRPESSYVSKFL